MNTIRHTMSVAVRLIDTTTGEDAPGRAKIRLNSKLAKMLKNGAFYVFLEELTGLVNIEIDLDGFEPYAAAFDLDSLHAVTPVYEALLVPNTKGRSPFELLEFRACKKGVVSVDCVRLIEASVLFSDYNVKKREMTLLNPFKASLSAQAYALLNNDNTSYEVFKIEKNISDTKIIVENELKDVPTSNTAIANMICGIAYDSGDYIVRVRDSAEKSKFLVREIYADTKKFISVDFKHQGENEKSYEKGG